MALVNVRVSRSWVAGSGPLLIEDHALGWDAQRRAELERLYRKKAGGFVTMYQYRWNSAPRTVSMLDATPLPSEPTVGA